VYLTGKANEPVANGGPTLPLTATERESEMLRGAAAAEGARRTASGLVFQSTEDGRGERPLRNSTVTVHYHGTLSDGTVFDSSVERGEPATFPLDGVIPGWSEGLQLMREGGAKHGLFGAILCQKLSIYQDRLGTHKGNW
jgi:hypothetical protein